MNFGKLSISKLLVIFITFLLGACSSNKRILIGVYEFSPEHENKIQHLYHDTKLEISKYNGRHLGLPFKVIKDLKNEASPAYTEDYSDKIVLISEFKNEEKLNQYLNSPSVLNAFKEIRIHTIEESLFVAKEFNPLGMMKPTPTIAQRESGTGQKFLMLNNIEMKSFLNPLTPLRIKRYMDSNFPNLNKNNVKIFTSYEKIQNIRGNYPFEVMFLTEWQSIENFENYHLDPEFVKLAKETRNKAFVQFTESMTQDIELK